MDLSGVLSYRTKNQRFEATNLDIALALAATFLLPLACMVLWDWSGALLPLALYYGAFCIVLVRWRKGSFDYSRPVSWALPLFLALLAVQVLTQLAGAMTIVPEGGGAEGVALTLLAWAPMNALLEQLLWAYIFDSFETRWREPRRKLVGGFVGVLMALIFVGMIHALFWGSFLPSFQNVAPWSYVFFAGQFLITPGYLLLYRRAGSMWPLFGLHIIADATMVIAGQYSIVPDLWTL